MIALTQTNYKFPGQTGFYKGKVRDVYFLDNDLVIMVASDRISAFDVVLPKGIPFKGQVLNQVAGNFLFATRDIVPNWVLASPDPMATIGIKCKPFKVEMVIRGYLSGHAAREYKAGKRMLCGIELPEGLKENDKLPEPVITPTTKADTGHDADISREEIIKNNLVEAHEYLLLEEYTRALFKRGTEIASERGLILVDTKYEFGKGADGKIYLIDEIHTPDSSRYFYRDGYDERQAKGEVQKQLSKEFLRQWLIANNFQGIDGQKIPEMSNEFIAQVSERYIELFEKITGKLFIKPDNSEISFRIENNILNWLSENYNS